MYEESLKKQDSYKTDGIIWRLWMVIKDNILDQDWKAGSYLPLRMFLDPRWSRNMMKGADKDTEYVK